MKKILILLLLLNVKVWSWEFKQITDAYTGDIYWVAKTTVAVFKKQIDLATGTQYLVKVSTGFIPLDVTNAETLDGNPVSYFAVKNEVASSTTELKNLIDSISSSTGNLAGIVYQLQVDTGALRSELDTEMANRISSDNELGYSTGVLSGQVNSLQSQVSSNDTDIANLGYSTGTNKNRIASLEISTANLQANKLDVTAKAADSDLLDGLNYDAFVSTAGDTMSGLLNVSSHTYIEGYLGVGTTNPLGRLAVSDGVNTDFIVTASGLVGIKMSEPKKSLHIGPDSGNTAYIHFTNNNTGTAGTDGTSIGINSLADLSIVQRENKDIRFYTNGINERMVIDNSGNVGIGAPSPAYGLDISSNVRITSDLFVEGISSATAYYGDGSNLTNLPQVSMATYAIDAGTAVYADNAGLLNGHNTAYFATVSDLSDTAASTGTIYVALNSTAVALSDEISRAINRENNIAVSTGTNADKIYDLQISTGENKNRIAALEVSTANLEANKFNLNQSSTQTVINGIPLLDTTPNGDANLKSFVNKEYVDLAVTSLGASCYMYDEDDGDTGYKLCYLSPSTSTEVNIEKTDLSDDELIGSWISAQGEAPVKLLKGVFNWYTTAEKTSGTQILRLYWKLIERKSDDSEIIVTTSSLSNEINSRESYLIPLQLDADYIPDTDSRIVGKLYASVSGGGNAPTVKIYYQGNTSSRWEIPANSEIFQNIFLGINDKAADSDLLDGKNYDAFVSTVGDTMSGTLIINNNDYYSINAQKKIYTSDSIQGDAGFYGGFLQISGNALLNGITYINGNIDMNSNWIQEVSTINGRDISVDGANLDQVRVDTGTIIPKIRKATQTWTGGNTYQQNISIADGKTIDGVDLSTITFGGADNLGNHTATEQLKMGNYNINTSSGITGLDKIIWADGTVQVSSPTAGDGGGDAYLASTQTFTGKNTFVNVDTMTITGRINWPDGSYSTSAVGGGAGTSVQYIHLLRGFGVADIYNSSSTAKPYGTWWQPCRIAGSLTQFDVFVASVTTDATTVKIWKNGASLTSFTVAAGSTHTIQTGAYGTVGYDTLIGVDFEDVDISDPIGGVAILGKIE